MSKALIKKEDHFPTITGDIASDTNELIGELQVGSVVIERGLARLYLIWSSREFLNATIQEFRCSVCGLESSSSIDSCPRCGGEIVINNIPLYPTLNDYVAHVSDESGKSRQTLFNRLRIYRRLSDERGVDPGSVFELCLLSPGAAKKLSDAEEDNGYLTLVNNSWSDTVEVALQQDTKSGALQFIKYDVLHEPKISAERISDRDYAIYLEYFIDNKDEYVVEQYGIKLVGEWTEEMIQWFSNKVGAKES